MILLNLDKKLKLKKTNKAPLRTIKYASYQISELKNLSNYLEKSGYIG